MNKTQSTTFITVLLSAALFSTSCTLEGLGHVLPPGGPIIPPWGPIIPQIPGTGAGPVVGYILHLAVISYQASQQQQAEAMERARKVSISKENQSRGVTRKAVVVNLPSGKGKGIIVVDSKTNKPVNDKVYVPKGKNKSAEKGQVIKLGGYEAEATDSLSA